MTDRKNSKQKSGEARSSLDRRAFIKSMGITAAVGMSGLSTGAASRVHAGVVSGDLGPGILGQSPLVMVWRRVSSLQKTKDFVGNTFGGPSVGHDPTSIMYDAGGALVGYSIEEVPASGESPVEICSELNLQPFSLQNNPASSLVYVPSDLRASLEKLRRQRGLAGAPSKTEAGERLSFLDEDGNFSILYRPSQAALIGKAGDKLNAILSDGSGPGLTQVSFQDDRRALPKPSDPLVAVELLVSDLSISKEFYKDVLGLRLLESGKDEARFDVGNLILTLRAEPTSGLVRFLAKSGRLMGDWFIFYAKDIKATTKALARNKVKFPVGIETSLIGDVAYFNDPDQYSLALWQPSGRTKMINFNPALERILKAAAVPRA